jgi:hypothetical protein
MNKERMPKQIVTIRMEEKGKKGRPWKVDLKKLKRILSSRE